MLANWKTTVAGIAAVMTALGHLLHALATGDSSTLVTDVPAIIAGIGLIFAKDSSTTP
jgi:hypothetical protein